MQADGRMADLHWSGLSFLGTKLLDELVQLYVHPRHLISAIDTEGDAAEILNQTVSNPGTANLNAYALQLYEWSVKCASTAKRARQATVRNLNTTCNLLDVHRQVLILQICLNVS